MRSFLVCLSILLSFSSASPAWAHALADACAAAASARIHPVLYATTRQVARQTRTGPRYGNDREQQVRYGVAHVSVPAAHATGCLELPIEVLGKQIFPDRDKHFLLQGAREHTRAQFIQDVVQQVGSAPGRGVLVFVHGFNVSFEDAVARGAQMQVDLGFQGPIIVFSWPSNGSLLRYEADQAVAGASAHHFESFLRSLRSRVSTVHVVAHSMGNEVVTRALAHIGTRRETVVQEVVFTAPDVDRDEFLQRLPDMRVAARRLTLYASANDRALKLSQSKVSYARAGVAGRSIVVRQGLDTVDASTLDMDFLGHSYFVSKPLLVDLGRIIGGDTPRERGLRELSSYWRFP